MVGPVDRLIPPITSICASEGKEYFVTGPDQYKSRLPSLVTYNSQSFTNTPHTKHFVCSFFCKLGQGRDVSGSLIEWHSCIYIRYLRLFWIRLTTLKIYTDIKLFNVAKWTN